MCKKSIRQFMMSVLENPNPAVDRTILYGHTRIRMTRIYIRDDNSPIILQNSIQFLDGESIIFYVGENSCAHNAIKCFVPIHGHVPNITVN